MMLKDAKLENLKVANSLDFNSTLKETCKENLPRNLYFDADILKTRPGTASNGKIIFNSADTFDNFEKVILTDCYYYKDNKKGRFIVIVDNDEISNITYRFFLVFSSGEALPAGYIEFTRTNFDSFGMPENFTVYSGKPTRGIGIYCMVRLVYGNGQEDMVNLYELSNDMSYWNYIYDSDYYVPTVLAFGRGISYYRAKEECNISLSKPVRLEDENLLTSQFVAYYSTDGFSSAFELPYENLGSEGIGCVYKTLSEEYSFSIAADETRSAPVDIDGRKISFLCNRALGIVYFTDEYNAAVNLPYLEIENNLRFSACRQKSNERLNLGAMTKSIEIPSGSEGDCNKTIVFYGNLLDEGGKLNWINGNNPLYFPKGCTATPGNIKNKLQGGFVFDNKLYIFDNEKMYTGNISRQKSFDLSFIIKGFSPASDLSYDKITFKGDANLPQKVIGDTVCVLTDRVLFAGESGGVYELSSGSLREITKVADLSYFEFTPGFAVTYKDGYILFNENEAYYYSPIKKSLFFWEIISTVIGGFSVSDECVLIAQYNKQDIGAIINTLTFNFDQDNMVVDYGEIAVCASRTVEAELICGFDDDSIYNKRLYAVEIQSKPCQSIAKIEIIADRERVYFEETTFEKGFVTIRYGAHFKELKLKIVGENISFIRARQVYLDSKTF